MEQAFPGNLFLFHLINASASPNPVLRALAVFCASDLVWLMIAAMAVFWVMGSAETRFRLMLAGLCAAIGLLANVVLGGLIGAPRPFMAGIGHLLIHHAPDASFPSDHGTLVWTVGLALGLRGPLTRFGALVRWGGLAVAWGRIYVGVHYPLDFLGAFTMAFVVVVLVLRQEARLAPLGALVERVWVAALGLLPRRA